MTHELIPTARRLARINPNRPRQADLKRAVSTAYYDPLARYTRAEVIILVSEAERAIRSLKAAPHQDRCAFAALVLLKRRK